MFASCKILAGMILLVATCIPINCSDRSTRYSGADKVCIAENGFLRRWHDFGGDAKPFLPWSSAWQEEELRVRFDQTKKDFLNVYFVDPEERDKNNIIWCYRFAYKVPENWKLQQSRYPYPLAFAYNLASSYYPASIININGLHFLAMEAPSMGNLNAFLQLIDDYNVTHLIKLTPTGDISKESGCFYWKGRTPTLSGDATILDIDGQDVYYYPNDGWQRYVLVNPAKLLALVKNVMHAGQAGEKMMGVHCCGGVGRTGTFIAAYVLIRDIDAQIARGVDVDHLQISIDGVLWQLLLQRPFFIAHFSQYLTLYHLVDYYVAWLKNAGEVRHVQ